MRVTSLKRHNRVLRGAAATVLVVITAGCSATRSGGAAPGDRAAAAAAEAHPLGEQVFTTRCVSCHTDGAEYAPAPRMLAGRTPEAIVGALTVGSMRPMAVGLSSEEIAAVATYLTGRPPVAGAPVATPTAVAGLCTDLQRPLDLSRPQWNGWGVDVENTRFQPNPGLAAADVQRLNVKWAFGYPGGGAVSQPTVVGGRVFVANATGVYSLDADTGCTYWVYGLADRGARAAIPVGPLPGGSPARFAAYVANRGSNEIHALNAETGELLWKTQVANHQAAQLTGAPTLHNDRLFVPVSSGEESWAAGPGYECCTFRGSIVALNVVTGEIIWKGYTIEEEPRPFQSNSEGVQMYGPAGAAIWSSPTVDARRGLIFAGTGNSYTEVFESGSSGIVAFDMQTGRVRWTNQVTENDNYVVGCFGPSENRGPPHANCPEELGPDWDFGASTILRTLSDGRQILLSGQKSGMVYGMDPADGEKLWQTRLGVGGPLGGIQWGFAADEELAYVAVSDEGHYNFRTEPPRPGISALRLSTGEVVWHTPAPERNCAWGLVDRPDAMYVPGGCSRAMSAPVTVIPGTVFVPSVDGNLRAFSARDGSETWTFNTARDWPTVNGVPAKGGSLNATGAVVVGGTLFLNSGYTGYGGEPGNVLLAFTVDGR